MVEALSKEDENCVGEIEKVLRSHATDPKLSDSPQYSEILDADLMKLHTLWKQLGFYARKIAEKRIRSAKLWSVLPLGIIARGVETQPANQP